MYLILKITLNNDRLYSYINLHVTAKISEAQQLREMDVKRMLLALRQPYARVRDRLNGINSVIPTRTQNLADANVPFFEGFMESLPDLCKLL